jgi:general secretion pathway protein H
MIGAGATRRAAAGFTLLELLVVLFIVGMVSAVAFPRLGRTGERVVLRTAAVQLGNQIRATRLAAVKSNAPQTLTVDHASSRYWSSIDPVPRSLPRRVRLTTEGDCINRGESGRAVIAFRPDGSACDASIALTDGSLSARVTIDWLTGATRVTWRL